MNSPNEYNQYILLAPIILVSLVGCDSGVSKPVRWNLPDGSKLVFYHMRPDYLSRGDHAKCLQLEDSKGKVITTFEFAASHSGYQSVELRISEDDSVIWIIDQRNKMIGASIVLDSKKFADEGGKHPAGVNPVKGRVIAPL